MHWLPITLGSSRRDCHSTSRASFNVVGRVLTHRHQEIPMFRFVKALPALALAFAVGGQTAHAQGWGYGGWGWGGWGGETPAGAYLNGLGRYAVGAGIYNYDTALANQINAQTFTQLNDYMAQVAHEAAFRSHARVHQEFLRDKTLYDAHIQSLRTNPTPQQIANGDALNQAVRDLSDPRIGSSAIRAANAPVDASLIADVPFQVSTDRVTLMLDELRKAFQWPEVFEESRFANDKKLFDDIVTRMRREDEEGDISPKTLQEARAMVNDLRTKITAQPLKDDADQAEAKRFINASTALLGLLDKPDTRAALSQLRKVKNTTIGNLLGFMHAYNLRFGPATTLKERQAYQKLYETLDQTRDQILTEAKIDLNNRQSQHPKVITDFYGRIQPQGGSQTSTE
jgi:hypothetical protein